MKQVTYTDGEGRRWRTELPDGVPDTDASMGMIIGPPPLAPLGLPLEIEVRLHNALHDRELFTLKDVKTRREHIMGAIMSALKVDVQAIVNLYQEIVPPQIDKAPPDQVRSLNGVSVMKETATGEIVPNASDVRERTEKRPRRRKAASRSRRNEE